MERDRRKEESERLAMRKKEVRSKTRKYDRRKDGTVKASGGGRGLRGLLQQREKVAEETARTSARLELLLNEEPGYIESEGSERTFRYRQSEIVTTVPTIAQQNYFELKLEELGPYSLSYSLNGRSLLIGGYKGHLALMDWREKHLGSEFNVRETVRDVQFLHNEMLFAVAQKRSVFIYDSSGMELHCLKKHNHVNKLEFLPYHFLLVSADDHGTLRYLDTSTGESVSEIKTKLGALKTIAQNPQNAIIQLGHYNGSVSLWSPSVSAPLTRLQCHCGPITSLSVDSSGHYLFTAAMDASVKVWDLRTYRSLHTYTMPRPVICMDVSRRGLLAIGRGQHISIWKDAISQRQSAPYLTHGVKGEVATVQFCPFEDCVGIGHSVGFTSMLVPGAGEPNFDALEANPFQTKRQRQESEVKQLLDKIPAEMIQLDPDSIAAVKKRDRVEIAEEEENEDEETGKTTRLKNRREKRKGKVLALKRQRKKEEQDRVKRSKAVHDDIRLQKGILDSDVPEDTNALARFTNNK